MRCLLITTLLVSALGTTTWAQTAPTVGAAVNAGDYSATAALGALVSIFGTNLGSGEFTASDLPLPTTLGGTSVELVGVSTVTPLPLYYVSPTQINAQLPYSIAPGSIQLRVRRGEEVSNAVSLSIATVAPRFFSVTQDGLGRPFLTKADYTLVTRTNPLKPGDYGLLFMNALGAVDPAIAEGSAPGDGSAGRPLNRTVATYNVRLGTTFDTLYSGLAPGWPGLYQVNFRAPYYNVAGDVDIALISGSATTQSDIKVPVEPNGFYYVLTGGKFPNGQTRNGQTGANSAIAFRHTAPGIFGDQGNGSWTLNTGATEPSFAQASGVALTLRNGTSIVYDNNGIETGDTGGYYDNRVNTVPDVQKPGLWLLYSNSTNTQGVFAGYFRLTAPTTFTEAVGYFDCNGIPDLRFDPDNIFNQWRMNIWSHSGGGPAQNSFTGDVFSSDTIPGTWSWSQTGVSRYFADGANDAICRVSYRLDTPFTLQPGEYWFSHDIATPPSSIVSTSTTASKERTAGQFYTPVPDTSMTLK